MQGSDRVKAADLLTEARLRRAPIPPLSEQYTDMTVEDAYDIQQLQTEQALATGRSIKGRKIGLTSRVMQHQLGVAEPDYGVLFADMFYAEHEPIPTSAFLQPRIEPEIAFVLGCDLAGPGTTVVDALRAVDMVLPALEIIDSRVSDWQISITDTIADNASAGGVVLGSTPVRIQDVDLRLIGCNLLGNGVVVATGAGGAVLGSPVLALVWLANVLGQHGVGLSEGDVVLPGSVTAAQQVRAGDTWSAQFGELGWVTACFAAVTR